LNPGARASHREFLENYNSKLPPHNPKTCRFEAHHEVAAQAQTLEAAEVEAVVDLEVVEVRTEINTKYFIAQQLLTWLDLTQAGEVSNNEIMALQMLF